MQWIASLDKFAATYKPKLQQEQKNFKTVIGGIISLIIYTTSFIYFCYKFYQFEHNQMNPVQSFAFEYQENLTMTSEEPFLKIFIQGSSINPFNQTNQILVPSIFYQGNFQSPQYITLDSLYETKQIDQQEQSFQPQNLSLSTGDQHSQGAIMIALQICNSLIHQNCSDQNTIDEFFKQNGLLVVTQIKTQQYNSFTQKIEIVPQKTLFAIDQTALFYQRTIMQSQILDVDQAPLIPIYDRYQFFSGFSIQTQTLRQNFSSTFLGGVFILELSLSQITEKKVVQFIKISQVLADVGSIFSSLMLLSIIISSLNETLMEEEILSQVVGIYYPQIKKIKMIRHYYFGPVKQVLLDDQIINKQDYIKFYQKAKEIAKKKLTVYGSIYQISRLQFLIQSLLPKEDFKDVHRQGIALNLNIEGSIGSIKLSQIQNQENDEHILSSRKIKNDLNLKFQDEDFDLLEKKEENDWDIQQKPLSNQELNEQINI